MGICEKSGGNRDRAGTPEWSGLGCGQSALVESACTRLWLACPGTFLTSEVLSTPITSEALPTLFILSPARHGPSPPGLGLPSLLQAPCSLFKEGSQERSEEWWPMLFRKKGGSPLQLASACSLGAVGTKYFMSFTLFFHCQELLIASRISKSHYSSEFRLGKLGPRVRGACQNNDG